MLGIPWGSDRLRGTGAAMDPEPDRDSSLLVVTPDDRFYCSLLYIATSRGWKTQWARTVCRGLDVLRSQTVTVVVLDWFRSEMDWRTAMAELSAIPHQPRILLASPAIDEDLWDAVLTHRGYDVVPRDGDPEQLIRTVRFACRSTRSVGPRVLG